jgi:hypothetical protein
MGILERPGRASAVRQIMHRLMQRMNRRNTFTFLKTKQNQANARPAGSWGAALSRAVARRPWSAAPDGGCCCTCGRRHNVAGPGLAAGMQRLEVITGQAARVPLRRVFLHRLFAPIAKPTLRLMRTSMELAQQPRLVTGHPLRHGDHRQLVS